MEPATGFEPETTDLPCQLPSQRNLRAKSNKYNYLCPARHLIILHSTMGLRESLIQTGKNTCGYLNCKIFVQTVTNIPNLESLPERPYTSIDDLSVGDILKWFNGLHYAIYLGDGDIMEVEEWGAPMRVVALKTVLEEMDPPEEVFSTAGAEGFAEEDNLSETTDKLSNFVDHFLKVLSSV